MCKVSVIVPVYNAEKTLRRCIKSIIEQTYNDIEIILINDGSTDSSRNICEEFENTDKRIKLINKSNEGVSASRNLGIECASGDYLMFADSDDWFTHDAVETMVSAADRTGCDMVISDFYRVKNNYASIKGDINEEGIMERQDFVLYMMDNPANFYYGAMWNKLYRRKIIIDNGLKLNDNINWCEDFMFNLDYIRCAETFYSVKKPLYYYVNSKNSLVKQNATPENSFKMKKAVFVQYKGVFEELGMYDRFKDKLKVAVFLIAIANDGNVNIMSRKTVKLTKYCIEKTKVG